MRARLRHRSAHRFAPRPLAVACAAFVPIVAGAQSAPPAATQLETVLVTANPHDRLLVDMAPPVSVLSGEGLLRAQQPAFGDTMGTLPGISSSYYGPTPADR
jgi:iron complex outermembrane receptor protein